MSGLKQTTKCLGYQQITNLTASIGLTVPAGTSWAMIQCEGQNVRWRDDGTAPTAAIGMLLLTGAIEPYLYDGDLNAVRFIQTAASATLNVSYYN